MITTNNLYKMSEEAQIAQAIENSLAVGADDINSDLYVDLRLEEHYKFNKSITQAINAIVAACKHKVGRRIDLRDIYTFTLDSVDAMPWGHTKHIANRFTIYPGIYAAMVVDELVMKQLDCGALTFDDKGYVVDSNTCLYNCVYVWMRAQNIIRGSLQGFISDVNKFGGIDRKRGDFGDEFVMKAICNLYHFPICTLWKSNNSQRISFITSDYVKKETYTTSICYLVNEQGTVHFRLMVPDL